MGWLRSDLMPIREERPTSSMFYQRADKPLSESARASLGRLVRISEQLIGESAFLFGDFSIADAELSFMLPSFDPQRRRAPRAHLRLGQTRLATRFDPGFRETRSSRLSVPGTRSLNEEPP